MRASHTSVVRALLRLPGLGLIWLCASLLPPTAAAGPGLDRLDRFFSGLKGLDTGFEQTVTDNARRPTQQTRGRLQILRPGRFRWTYEEPYQQLIVTDGAKLWVYDPDLTQVTISKLDAAVGNTPALLLSTEQPLDQLFMITELPPQDDIAWVQLDPRQEDANFTRIRLAFDRDTLYAMEIVDGFGQTMNIRFLGLERNPALDPNRFRFTPPAGVDVVGDG
ncbi:MAG: outer membrane lipoprotein chaperone LolA [Gammaproteobacteria bacterium]|nr:outer membrane lipoprotein chaperone LolA [Gammaproteobacteria bacterium]